MCAILKNAAFALIAISTSALCCNVASAQTVQPPELAVTGAPKVPLMIGDKLKISFFETIDVGAAKRTGADSAAPPTTLRTFYQRMDVSGEYTIEQDGAISLPLMGRFLVEGRALDDVCAEIGLSFTKATGQTARIDMKIAERSPIYVVGPVKNPGAYKYAPGMIVLQSVALAGGVDRGERNLSGMIEGARQSERLRSLTLEVQQLLARRSRLLAERDGETVVPMPTQLLTIAGEAAAKNFLATETTILRAEQLKRQQEQREIGLKIMAAHGELDALNRKLDEIDVQRNLKKERLEEVQKLKDRGLVTTTNVLAMRSEISDLDARRQDHFVAIIQANARLAEVEGTRAKLASEHAASLASAISSVEKDLAVAHEAMITASSLASVLDRPAAGPQDVDAYEIVRQSRDGATTQPATETSVLLPGDVLKVNLKATASRPASNVPLSPPMLQFPEGHAANKSLITWRIDDISIRPLAAGLTNKEAGSSSSRLRGQGHCEPCRRIAEHPQSSRTARFKTTGAAAQ
jgi:protein involved in polysaccharide export with SLBB domain